MGFESPTKETPEEIQKAEKIVTPEQVRSSETRKRLLEKAMLESGLDPETFNEIAMSFNGEPANEEGGAGYSFRVRGHEIREISHTGKKYGEVSDILYVDGIELSLEQAEPLRDKYNKTVIALFNINKYSIESDQLKSALTDLLK